MAITAREIRASRSQAFDAAGFITGFRTFTVFNVDDDSGAPIELLVEEAITAVGIVKDDIWPDPSSLKASHITEAARVEGHFDLVVIIWKYIGLADDPDNLFTTRNFDQSRQFEKVYRKPPELVIPADGDLGDFFDGESAWHTEIGGTPNDIEGFRETELVYKESLIITEFRDDLINWGILGEAVGKRNAQQFQTAPRGKVVYAGSKSRTINSTITALTHTFVYSERFHLVQVARRDQGGRIIIEPFDFGDFTRRVARFVFWRQPFPEFIDFTTIGDF